MATGRFRLSRLPALASIQAHQSATFQELALHPIAIDKLPPDHAIYVSRFTRQSDGRVGRVGRVGRGNIGDIASLACGFTDIEATGPDRPL